MRRARLALGLALALMFGSLGAAWASGSSQASGYTHFGWQDCPWGQVWISSFNLNLDLTALATVDWEMNGGPCLNHQAQAGPGNLAVKQDLIYFNNARQTWEMCSAGPWVQNGGPSHEVWTGFRWGLWNRNPCPGGLYYGQGWSAHWHGDWHGLNKVNITGVISVP